MDPTLISTLTDEQARTVLGLVLDHDRALPDPAALREVDAHVAEAATEPLPAELGEPAQSAGTSGDLARDTLTYLVVTDPDRDPVVQRAIAMAQTGMEAPSRIDPLTIGIGALVILALQSDVKLERTPTGRWSFKFHKAAMKDSTLGDLIARVISSYTGQR